jgi:molybdate transport system substrate-binding protein
MRTSRTTRVGARRAFFVLTGLLAALLALAGCEREEGRPPGADKQPTSSADKQLLPSTDKQLLPSTDKQLLPSTDRQLTVFAASSLRDGFTALSSTFKTAHPGVEVTFNFAGSQELRAQIEQGAPADVLASADSKHMETLLAASRVLTPVLFTRNEPVVIVARESAPQVHGIADLPALERIVLGAAEVPIGRYTQQILERATATLGGDFRQRVEARVVSRELNVRQVLSKVSLGEAQAGIVYRTDARSAKDAVITIPIPKELNVIAEYPIAIVAGAGHPRLARAWLELVTSSAGQRALAESGFLPVGEPQP